MTNYSYNLHGIEELITAPPDYKYYANPGDVIIMQQPITNYEGDNIIAGHGDLVRTIKINDVDVEVIRGFCQHPHQSGRDVGKLEATPNQLVEVKYTHLFAVTNRIYFLGARKKAVIEIGDFTIHDHSSMAQGGPAYGTYFNKNIKTS